MSKNLFSYSFISKLIYEYSTESTFPLKCMGFFNSLQIFVPPDCTKVTLLKGSTEIIFVALLIAW